VQVLRDNKKFMQDQDPEPDMEPKLPSKSDAVPEPKIIIPDTQYCLHGQLKNI
jgi:hypothetical protein